MNKNKIVMSAIGGVALLAVLVLGWFVWSAWEEKEEKVGDLESLEANVKRINAGAISPEQASVDAIEENQRKLAGWRDAMLMGMSEGDRVLDTTVTPEAFKRQLGDEARALARLPGGVEGRIVADGFTFGFKGIIDGDKMPERDQLAFMQRQWADIKLFTEQLSQAGAQALLDVAIAPRAAAVSEEETRPRRGARGKKVEEEKKPIADTQSYTLKFQAPPAAFVRALNALVTSARYIVVDNFSFTREDTLAEALGDKDKDTARSSGGGGRRGRRGGAQVAETAEEDAGLRKGLVTDPAKEGPLTVTMTLTTYDFGTKSAEAEQKAVTETGTAKEKEVEE